MRSAAVLVTGAVVAVNALARGGGNLVVFAATVGAAVGVFAVVFARARTDSTTLPVLPIGLAFVAVFTGLQVVPLPPQLVRAVAPASAAVFEDAWRVLGVPPRWHPLSLDWGATALELAHAAVAVLFAATAAMLAASDRRRDQLLRGIVVAGVLVISVCYASALLGLAPLLESHVTFVNPNHRAGFLQLCAWPALGFSLRARGASRLGWLAAFAFIASGIFLSLSRAGIASFFIGAGLFVWMSLRRAPTRDLAKTPTTVRLGLGRRVVRLLSSRFPLIAGVTATFTISSWLAFDAILSEMRTVSDASTTSLKLGMWPLAVSMIRDFPLFGIGRGAFALAYPAYKWEPVQRTFTHVENEWLQVPVELGIVAGIALIVVIAWAYVAAMRKRELSRPLAGALAGVGAPAAHSLFDFSLEMPGVAIPFAIVLGIASRDMPRIAVRARLVGAGAIALALLAIGGVALHRAQRSGADAVAVVESPTADEAILRARESGPAHPADYVPFAAVGSKLVTESRCREAMPWLLNAMTRSPTSPEAHRAAGRCFAVAGKLQLAKRHYRLAFSYGDASVIDEAHAVLTDPRALLDVVPDTPDGLLAAGAALADSPADAVEAWTRAWEEFGEVRALPELARALLGLGDAERSLLYADRLQSQAPKNPWGYIHASRALDALRRVDDAQAALELGAARLPGVPEVLVPLGLRLVTQHRYSQAKAVFEGIVAREGPTLAYKHALIARALEGQSRYQEAIREAQTAREIAPDDARALVAFARCAVALGRYDDALEALQRAAQLPATPRGTFDARIAEIRAQRAEQEQRRAASGSR